MPPPTLEILKMVIDELTEMLKKEVERINPSGAGPSVEGRVTFDIDDEDGNPRRWIEFGELIRELIKCPKLTARVERWGLELTSTDIHDMDAQDYHTTLTGAAVEDSTRVSHNDGTFSISWCFC